MMVSRRRPRRWEDAVRRPGLGRVVAMASAMSGTQWLLRAVIVIGATMAAVVTMVMPGAALPLAVVALLVGLALAIAPQAVVAPLFHVLIMFAWLVQPGAVVHLSAVWVATGMALVQVATAAASLGQPSLPVPATVLRPFLIMAGTLIAAAAVVGLGLRALQTARPTGLLGLMIMAMLGAAALGVVVVRRARFRPAE